ncbi:MAG: HEAT repeat domain-containing protein [Nitrospiraceae bacterium]
MVTRSDCPEAHPQRLSSHVTGALFLSATIALCPVSASAVGSAGKTASSVESRAAELFKAGDYAAVTILFQGLPPDTMASKPLLRLSLLSYVRLGRADEALAIYTKLNPPGETHDAALLRPLALAVITSRVRDRQEHVRIAAYTALAELGLRETAAILEDGLLDSSVLVRARAAEAIGKVGLAANSGALRRALGDEMPTVRIAAMTALGEGQATDLTQRFVEISRRAEGPEAVFADAALYRLGRSDKFADITASATLPDADVRMAALGILGRLKRPASLAVLAQAVYDPIPSVRAFAAGALGEFGSPDGAAPLTHAVGDETAMVRAVAAGSLGRLGLRENRPLLQALTRDSSFHVRTSAAEGLLRLGDPSAISLAAELARHPDPSIRGAAAQALSVTAEQQALSILHTLSQDQQPLPRLMAAKALGKHSGVVVPTLVNRLKDSDEAVRIAAAASLLQQLVRPSSSQRRH